MAWTEKLSSGRWRGGYRDTAGRKQYVSNEGRGFERKTDARDAAQEAEVQARREAARSKGTLAASITWGDWWDHIVKDRYAGDSNTESTETRIVRRYIRPQWGDEPLNRIEQPDVQAWVNALTAGTAVGWTLKRRPEPSYVHRVVAVFKASITLAVPKVLKASPCVGLKMPTIPKKRKAHTTDAAMEKLAPTLREDYAAAIEFEHETGLRPGELCGLHEHRVDLDRRIVEVCEVLVDRKHVIRPFPKDKDSRIVPLTARAVEIIKPWVERARETEGGCGLPHTDEATCASGLVFRTLMDRPMSPQEMSDRTRYSARHRGAPRVTPYDARRGFATRGAAGGLNPFELAWLMGHEDINQTKGYVQETEETLAKMRAALGDRPGLRVVGQRGADRGADFGQQVARSDTIGDSESGPHAGQM